MRFWECCKKWFEIIVYWLINVFFILSIWAAANLYIKQIVPEYCYALSAVFTGVLIVVWMVLCKKTKSINICVEKRIPLCITIFIFPLVLKLLIIWVWDMPIAGDIGVYIQCARELADSGIVSTYADYSLRFPHLFWMGVILSVLCKIGTSYKVFQITFAILGTIVGWTLYKSLHVLFGERKARVVALIYSYMPSTLFACMATTHEMVFQLALACVIGIVAIYKSTKNKGIQWLWFGILCVVMAGMSLINQMTTILVITIILLIIFYEKKGWKKKTVQIMALLASLIFVAQFAPMIQKAHTESDHNVAQKAYAWAIYVGSNYETEGRYNEEDKQNISTYIFSETGMKEYDTRDYEETAWILAKDRWIELISHPISLVKHLFHKFMIVWSGTHFAIEYANVYQTGMKHLMLLGLMVINNFIYMFMNLVTWNQFRIDGRKILDQSALFFGCCIFLLGCVCVLLMAEVMNKYNLTAVIPIYIIWGMSICGRESPN